MEFLKFLQRVNEFEYNSNRSNNTSILDKVCLSEDERWTSQLYSFKGDSLKKLIGVGINNPSLACNVIALLFNTIVDQVRTTVEA